jgi:hypothetical protein
MTYDGSTDATERQMVGALLLSEHLEHVRGISEIVMAWAKAQSRAAQRSRFRR